MSTYSEYETAKTVISMSNDVLKTANVAFPMNEAFLTSFGLIGLIVNGIITLAKPKIPGLGSKLTEISGKLTQISRKLDSRAARIENLIVEHSFVKDLTIKVDILERLMREVIEDPTSMRRKEFLDECSRNSPYTLVLAIKGRLTYDSTNPIIKALEVDELKTTKTIINWRETIESLTNRLMIINSYFVGHQIGEKYGNQLAEAKQGTLGGDFLRLAVLLNIGQSMNTTKKAVEEIKEQLHRMYNNYDTKYWPETVRRAVEKAMEGNDNQKNYYKAILISQKLDQIHTCRKLDSRAARIENLIVEHSFVKDLTIKVDILERLMREVIEDPTSMRRKEFLDECSRNSPYTLVLAIKGRLTYDSTNPIIKALEVDELKTTKTIINWRETIESLTNRLMIINSYFVGHQIGEKYGNQLAEAKQGTLGGDFLRLAVLLNIGQSMNTTKKAVEEIKEQLHRMYNNYDTKYWPETVRRAVEKAMEGNDNQKNYYKAILISQKLDQIHTWDQFYVIVFDDHVDERYSMIWHEGQGLLVQRGNCKIVVYRSKHINMFMNTARLNSFKNAVEQYTNKYISGYTDLEATARNIYNDLKKSQQAGFVGIIAENHNVGIDRPVRRLIERYPWIRKVQYRGPGWFTTANCCEHDACCPVKKVRPNVQLIVGHA